MHTRVWTSIIPHVLSAVHISQLEGLDGSDASEAALEAALDRWLADDEREYIEVEEPEEPVEMVDSWCQVRKKLL